MVVESYPEVPDVHPPAKTRITKRERFEELADIGVSLSIPTQPKESWYSVSESQETGQIELLAQDPDGYLMRSVQIFESREARR